MTTIDAAREAGTSAASTEPQDGLEGWIRDMRSDLSDDPDSWLHAASEADDDPGHGLKPLVRHRPTAKAAGPFDAADSFATTPPDPFAVTGSFPAAATTGSFPVTAPSGAYPSIDSGSFPAVPAQPDPPTVTPPTGLFDVTQDTNAPRLADTTGSFAVTSVSEAPLSDTGSFPTRVDADSFPAGSTTGSFATGSFPVGSTTGSLRTQTDTGSFAARSATGSFPTGSTTGSFPTGSTTGSFRAQPSSEWSETPPASAATPPQWPATPEWSSTPPEWPMPVGEPEPASGRHRAG